MNLYSDNNIIILKRFTRYVIVGLSMNFAGYFLYLLATTWLDKPKTVVSCLYLVGASASYYFNRQWTFQQKGSVKESVIKYAVTQFFGYLLNLAMLLIFVDYLGYPHRIVQLFAIFTVALFLFLAFNFFVYKEKASEPALKMRSKIVTPC